MLPQRVVVSLCFLTYVQGAVDFLSPLVFDAEFYATRDPSLWTNGIRNEAAARNHWLAKGIDEGRQACGSFHSKQYLERHPDLKKAFGSNYKQAIVHFLTFGQQEHRLGYLEGGYQGRWTISNGNDLFLSGASRTAGAIDSVVWNQKEFINAFDHGRELQMATNTDTWSECFNPTEGGARDDGQGATSRSQIHSIAAQGRVLTSSVHPAFWLLPGNHETDVNSSPCHNGVQALNKEIVYPYPLSKEVTIGCAGSDNCIKFVSHFTIAGHWPNFNAHQFEAPTGYMSRDFTVYRSLDRQTFQIKGYNNADPIIFSTPDDKYAMGVYTPAGQDTDLPMYYGAFIFGLKDFGSGTTKWNVVFRKHGFPDGSTHTLTYVTYICVGNVHIVTDCLKKAVQTYPHV